MNTEQCRAIMEHLPIVQAVAEGKDVFFAAFNWEGKFIGWRRTNKVLLAPLAAGFYAVKPRYSCMKERKPIPYPHQAEAVRR